MRVALRNTECRQPSTKQHSSHEQVNRAEGYTTETTVHPYCSRMQMRIGRKFPCCKPQGILCHISQCTLIHSEWVAHGQRLGPGTSCMRLQDVSGYVIEEHVNVPTGAKQARYTFAAGAKIDGLFTVCNGQASEYLISICDDTASFGINGNDAITLLDASGSPVVCCHVVLYPLCRRTSKSNLHQKNHCRFHSSSVHMYMRALRAGMHTGQDRRGGGHSFIR